MKFTANALRIRDVVHAIFGEQMKGRHVQIKFQKAKLCDTNSLLGAEIIKLKTRMSMVCMTWLLCRLQASL